MLWLKQITYLTTFPTFWLFYCGISKCCLAVNTLRLNRVNIQQCFSFIWLVKLQSTAARGLHPHCACLLQVDKIAARQLATHI